MDIDGQTMAAILIEAELLDKDIRVPSKTLNNPPRVICHSYKDLEDGAIVFRFELERGFFRDG
jgi:hypothetical protein